MIDLSEFEALKRQADKARREADRAQGAVAQLKEQLESEYGCKSVKAAEKLSEKILTELAALEEEFDEKFAEFKSEFAERRDG